MAKKTTKATKPKTERPAKKERRSEDRRETNEPVVKERRKVQRRRQIDPTTCERDYSQDEIEFMDAMDAYKRANGRMFPTCSEILEVVRGLGYTRTPVGDEFAVSASEAEGVNDGPLESQGEAAVAVATIDSDDDSFDNEFASDFDADDE